MAYIERDFPIERLNEIALKEGNSKRPVYQMHKWWARRLGSVFRMLVLASLCPDDVVEDELWHKFYNSASLKDKVILDPFMGGGTTVVEALRLGCRVVGVDINPVAWFITKKEVEHVSLDELDRVFEGLEETVGRRINSFYRTRCPAGHQAEVTYALWVKTANCRQCHVEVALFPNYRLLHRNGIETVLCPHCWQVAKVPSGSTGATCPDCHRHFNPYEGNSGMGRFRCTSCEAEETTLEAVKRLGDQPLPLRLYAIEYACESCGRGFKRADDDDVALYQQAQAEFRTLQGKLFVPSQAIPTEGRSDPRPVNHGYKFFWQMFNERQLLCLALLLQEILKIKDQNVKEYLLVAFSDCLETNNLFCKYEVEWQKISVLFGLHAYHPIERPAENNVWGGNYGRGTFSRCFRKVRRGKVFMSNTFERQHENGRRRKIAVAEEVEGRLAAEFVDLTAGANVLLACSDSTSMPFVPDKSVDAVITDPPYLDNVMYSELADFFYVWLREALKETYPFFGPEHCERTAEIVKNDKGGKSAADFQASFGQVLGESCRKLKDDGVLVFTFHHNKPWGWETIGNALLDSGLCVVAAPIVRSEGKSGFHSSEGNIKYDAVLVCRKREPVVLVAEWRELETEILRRSRQWIDRIGETGMTLNKVDVAVVVYAKIFEVTSQHWPRVFRDGRAMTTGEILSEVGRMAGSISNEATSEADQKRVVTPRLLDSRQSRYEVGKSVLSDS